MRAAPGFLMFGASASSRVRPKWTPGRSSSRGPGSGLVWAVFFAVPPAWESRPAPVVGILWGS
jgi:hypothetical protein